MIEPRTLARPYARAAFEYAQSSDALGDWQTALDQLAALASDAKVRQVLNNPAHTGEQRVSTLTGLADVALPSALVNFVALMAENDRLALLPDVAGLFGEFKQALESSVAVDVTSAFEISEADSARLAEGLAKQLARAVTMTHQTDPTLIGGAVIRAGDVVIDGSVRGRLEKLAGALTP